MSVRQKALKKREEKEEKFFSSLNRLGNIAGCTAVVTIVILQLIFNQISVG